MISRGEMGSIVAGVGVTSGALSADIYTTLMHITTTPNSQETNVAPAIWERDLV